MTRLLITITCGLALGLAVTADTARADQGDRTTILTFNEPIEIPGRVLPAGRYRFRLLDPEFGQNVVEISSADGRQVIATLVTVPRYRGRTPDKTYVTFRQRTPGAPAAIRAWFYPGNDEGVEFVYPKTRALALARAEQEPVKATSDELAPHMTTPGPQPEQVQALKSAPVQVAQPTGEVVELEEVFAAELPQTASLVPAELVVGLGLLIAGFALHVSGRRARRSSTR